MNRSLPVTTPPSDPTASSTPPRRSDASRPLDVERAVRERYSAASTLPQEELCCPVSYDDRYLEVLPREIVERDYGCGDPSRYVERGQTVLDLGAGGGKICYIASQMVGPEGRVLGVDMNDDMLALARRHQRQIGDAIGWHNVEFRKGRIQDLGLDLERLDAWLSRHPVRGAGDWLEMNSEADRLRREEPLVADESVDLVLSNCVLNLVRAQDRSQLFRELHRVLRTEGRVVISDIVSDEPVPESLRRDSDLWSGCISGAFVETELLEAFAHAGFGGMRIEQYQEEPWATVEGIEFRSVTVSAWKPSREPCLEQHHAVVYRGPWKVVIDDDGHAYERGARTAVCGRTYAQLLKPPYAGQVIPIPPRSPVSENGALPFDNAQSPIRDPRESKGSDYQATRLPSDSACGESGCC